MGAIVLLLEGLAFLSFIISVSLVDSGRIVNLQVLQELVHHVGHDAANRVYIGLLRFHDSHEKLFDQRSIRREIYLRKFTILAELRVENLLDQGN